MQEYGFALQGPFSMDTKDWSALQQIGVYDIALQVKTFEALWPDTIPITLLLHVLHIVTYCIKSSITVVNQVETYDVQ